MLRDRLRVYRTPVILGLVFVGMLLVFAITPDRGVSSLTGAESTPSASEGPAGCPVCGIDKTCDPATGMCVFLDHTPLPCVKSAKFDDEAGYCLPEGAPPAPSVVQERPRTGTGSDFPGGIGGRSERRARQPNLPGFGN